MIICDFSRFGFASVRFGRGCRKGRALIELMARWLTLSVASWFHPSRSVGPLRRRFHFRTLNHEIASHVWADVTWDARQKPNVTQKPHVSPPSSTRSCHTTHPAQGGQMEPTFPAAVSVRRTSCKTGNTVLKISLKPILGKRLRIIYLHFFTDQSQCKFECHITYSRIMIG